MTTNMEATISNTMPNLTPTKYTPNSVFTASRVEAVSKEIVKVLTETVTMNLEFGPNIAASVAKRDCPISPYPFVVIIGGGALNGKDTFINEVSKHCSALNLSSINEVKDAVDILIDESTEAEKWYSDVTVSAGKHRAEKSDQYRQFLHEVKMAWSKFNNGPNHVLLGRLVKILAEHTQGGEQYDVIFMHLREADEIASLRYDIMDKLHIPVVTLCVSGRVDASVWQNDGDHNTNNYNYDINIRNCYAENTAILALQGMIFGELAVRANNHYGIYPETVSAADNNSHTGTEIIGGGTVVGTGEVPPVNLEQKWSADKNVVASDYGKTTPVEVGDSFLHTDNVDTSTAQVN